KLNRYRTFRIRVDNDGLEIGLNELVLVHNQLDCLTSNLMTVDDPFLEFISERGSSSQVYRFKLRNFCRSSSSIRGYCSQTNLIDGQCEFHWLLWQLLEMCNRRLVAVHLNAYPIAERIEVINPIDHPFFKLISHFCVLCRYI